MTPFEPMRSLIDDLTLKARDAVVASRDLLDRGDSNGAVNRAYYGIFNVTRAYLLYAGQPIDGKHGAIVQAFGLHLVKAGYIDKSYGRLFNRIQEARTDADYTASSVPAMDAQEFIKGAEELYDQITNLIPPGLLPPGHARRRSQADHVEETIRRSLASAFCRAVEARGEILPMNFETNLIILFDQKALTADRKPP